MLSVLDEDWRADKLDMPDIPVSQSLFPRDEESDQFGEHLRKLEEDQHTWKDLSVHEMVHQAYLSDKEGVEMSEQQLLNLHLDQKLFVNLL